MKKLSISNYLIKTEFKRGRKLNYTIVGTPEYIVTELFSRNRYDESVDWWSLGVILSDILIFLMMTRVLLVRRFCYGGKLLPY